MLKDTLFYFAYGSNVNITRLNERIGRVISFETFILPDYKLTFDAGLNSSQTSFANIVKSKRNSVEGILYQIVPEQASMLDRYELLYERKYFIVGDKVCFTYVSDLSCNSRPSFHYLDIIETGARDFGLLKLASICEKEKESCIYLIPKSKGKRKRFKK